MGLVFGETGVKSRCEAARLAAERILFEMMLDDSLREFDAYQAFAGLDCPREPEIFGATDEDITF